MIEITALIYICTFPINILLFLDNYGYFCDIRVNVHVIVAGMSPVVTTPTQNAMNSLAASQQPRPLTLQQAAQLPFIIGNEINSFFEIQP